MKRVEVNLEILKANIDFPTQFAEVLARYRILLVYRGRSKNCIRKIRIEFQFLSVISPTNLIARYFVYQHNDTNTFIHL